MKVYAHYEIINGIEYRWRTLLQIGNSWKICGTVVMKNPGSSRPINMITDNDLLQQLESFDNTKNYKGHCWYEFSVDNTMGRVGSLFEDYLRAKNKPVEGVIQIFNLFNIRGVDLYMALEKMKNSQGEALLMTTDDDINNLIQPIYLGWGNLKNNKYFKDYAEKFFEKAKQDTSYLDQDYNKNPFLSSTILAGIWQ